MGFRHPRSPALDPYIIIIEAQCTFLAEIGMARDLIFVGNGVDVLHTNPEREQPQQLQHQVPWPDAVKFLGQIAIQIQDPIVVATLDTPDEKLCFGIIEQ